MEIALLFIVFFGMLAVGIPIAFSIGIASISASMIIPNLPASADYIFRTMVSSIDSTSLLAVPLFILSGIIMAKGGISEKLFNFFAFFLGKRTAGLPITVIITCLFFGAISGSGPATVAAVGAMSIPLLVRLGYDKVFVTAMVATSGGLGVIIPPSIPFIIYGISTGTSVGDLFIAGILPGLLIGLCLIVYVYFYFKKHGEDKEKLIKNWEELSQFGLWKLFKDSFWALMAPVIILGGIYGGIVTPTEAANISVIYALIVSLFIYKSIKVSDIFNFLKETLTIAAPVMLVVSTASVFGKVLTMMQAPQMIASSMANNFSSAVVITLVIMLFLIIVGMVMDTTPAILILAPIFLPIASAIGINPIHFGLIMVVTLAIGFVTPPVGLNLFVASSLSKLSVLRIGKASVPFIIVFIFALLLITFIPEISLILVGK
ncbi:TRAP transporter large permease [Robertmurraya massiliosenegalensis]|uniref:TRAP transporter large permease n=1 Tax=Robertmurraya TaxID=2837507 RepID=UPI0039A4B51B